MQESRGDRSDSIVIYESRPPEWLSKTHSSADIGYPGFHPPIPGQEEDELSNTKVKSGFVLGHVIPAETFSGAQDGIKAFVHQDDALSQLEDLMNQVFTRKLGQVPPIPPSSFRIPSRVTLSDTKRQAWFADLADPCVPLHKLGKSVPHGAKGHDLLDLLHANNVAIPRAVWLLRVFGANETAGLRNKPSYNPTQYSVEWANLVNSYLKKQLADIALPSAPRPGMNIKQTFKGVLSEPETRERWVSRFSYSLKLLQPFLQEGLVDNRTFFTWLVHQMSICNLAQAGFLTRLADDYLDGMLCSRPLIRPFIDACLSKISEIRSSPVQDYLSETFGLLCNFMQRVCLAHPDAFVSPRTWSTHSHLLCEILSAEITRRPTDQQGEQNGRHLHQLLVDNVLDIKRRCDSMLFRNLPHRALASLDSAVSDIQVLNSISSSTSLDSIQFFPASGEEIGVLTEKVDILLTWSVTPLQYGEHRPIAAATLILDWRNKAEDRASRRDTAFPDEFLQDVLFDWLDSSDVAADTSNIREVSVLYGELIKQGLFSYANYVQRLIARGEIGLSSTEGKSPRHREFLRCIPLHASTPSVITQRKVALYGIHVRKTPEELNEREMRKEIRGVLPELFNGGNHLSFVSAGALLHCCPTMVSATRFEQVRTLDQWLLPILRKWIASQESEVDVSRVYCVAIELMHNAQCYTCVLEVSLTVLERVPNLGLLTAVIETCHRYSTIWACMNVRKRIAFALYTTYQSLRAKGIQSRILSAYLIEIDGGEYLDKAARDQITNDIASFSQALRPFADRQEPVPRSLPEILVLADQQGSEAASLLANSLWYKYRSSSDWAWKVWDNTVASLCQIPSMTTNISNRETCALRYGSFLLHVDQHLPSGLDDQILQWLLGSGKEEVFALNSEIWEVLTVVIVYLSVHGALATTTVLTGIVYPAWQLASKFSAEQGGKPDALLSAANNLFDCLVFKDEGNSNSVPPTDLFDVQRLQTRRRDVYREPHFSTLLANIPSLVVIENNLSLSEAQRLESVVLRSRLCQNRDFRQAAFRNLGAVRIAFESPSQSGEIDEALDEPIVGAVRMVLGESWDSTEFSKWQDIRSLLSPWKLAATTIQLQFMLREMGRALSNNLTRQTANLSLDRLTWMIFRQPMTQEQAYFVAEMVRGVGVSVAEKFLINGMQFITEILGGDAHLSENIESAVKRSGEVLRILIHIAKPLREVPQSLPRLEPEKQDAFLGAIYSGFQVVEKLAGEASIDQDVDEVGCLIFLSRLLQFALGFCGSWTPKASEYGKQLLAIMSRLLIVYGAGVQTDLTVFSILMDTMFYVLDEIPSDTKSLSFDPFRNYPEISWEDLPSDMPSELRSQIRALLHTVERNGTVADLSLAYRDSAGNLIRAGPVINRPWEWTENLGEPSILDNKEGEKELAEKQRLKTRYLVKNSGSTSLETFEARMTGDGLIKDLDPRVEGNVRTFEDGLFGESIFRRDWREMRLMSEQAASSASSSGSRVKDGEEAGEVKMLATYNRADRKSTPQGSPGESSRSRTSGTGATTSLRPSPGLSQGRPPTTAINKTVEIEIISNSTPNKRKAKKSDDEVEIIEGPLSSASTRSKRPKAKPPAKTKSKKR